MNIPKNLKYTESHEWVDVSGGAELTVGITDHAQAQLGSVVFVQLPQPGQRCEAGASCGTIESVKAASDLVCPLDGEIVAVNEALAGQPELLNETPYGAWLFRIRPARPEQLEALLDAARYAALAGEE